MTGHGALAPSGEWWPGHRLALDGTGRVAARSHHPSGRPWRPDRARLLERLAAAARAGGAPWPRVAAAMLVLRGIAGDDAATFAARLGIGADALDRLESGWVPASTVPARLRSIPGLVDWAWVDGDPGPLRS
jgi:hypothetical protein